MNKVTKMLCFLLAMILMLSLGACGEANGEKPDNSEAREDYIGTWKGSDHDGENVVHYLVFDNDGYWKVYLDYAPLVRAIKQLPDQLVSFKVFCRLQNSGQTKCYYEYVENGDLDYTTAFTLDADGKLKENIETEVVFTKISTHSGEPDETVVQEARELFDRAREEALS